MNRLATVKFEFLSHNSITSASILGRFSLQVHLLRPLRAVLRPCPERSVFFLLKSERTGPSPQDDSTAVDNSEVAASRELLDGDFPLGPGGLPVLVTFFHSPFVALTRRNCRGAAPTTRSKLGPNWRNCKGRPRGQVQIGTVSSEERSRRFGEFPTYAS